MVKTGALLLLLAVAASHVGLLSAAIDFTESLNISTCPITFYGETYSFMEVLFHLNSSVEICFKDLPSDPSVHCLVLEDASPADSVTHTEEISPGDSIDAFLPNFESFSFCSQNILLHMPSADVILFQIFDFGHQAAVSFQTYIGYGSSDVVLSTWDGDVLLDSWTFNSSETFDPELIDVSGCIYSDALLLPKATIPNPEKCSNIYCNESAYLFEEPYCGHLEVCLDNGMCAPQTIVCTVVGPSVIDFFDRTFTIQDRCVYTLMKGYQDGNYFNITAGFQERRRKDVPFLDYMIIYLSIDDMTIYLGQGGRVEVNGTLLPLNTTTQLVSGAELRKDPNGVIIATILDVNMTVYFDGNIAYVTGKTGKAVEGLCGNANSSDDVTEPSAEKSSYYSSFGCEIQHKDIEDNTIDCDSSTLRCNLTAEAPFTACHDYVDQSPYYSSCFTTSCRYPDVDGLICRYFEAYVMSCSLKSDVILGDWRSDVGCSVVLQDSCRDQYCSSNEFCGEKLGETRCLCRALFAATFNSTNPYGEPTVCMQNSATLTLAACLLWDSGINYLTLHLNDENCVGHFDNQTHMVTFSFDSNDICGTEIMTTSTEIIFKNAIVTRNNTMDSIINRDDHVEIDFSCYYPQPDNMTMSLRIKNSSVVQHIVSDVWNYTVMMNAYLDPNHLEPIGTNTEIQINQRVWMELKAEELDAEMVTVVTDSCWATSQPSPAGSLRYDLIIDGCPNPADQTVELQKNGQGLFNYFSFSMFEFFGEGTEIYLHCQLELCPTQGQPCAPDCSKNVRKRRSSKSKYLDGNSALLTMVWNN